MIACVSVLPGEAVRSRRGSAASLVKDVYDALNRFNIPLSITLCEAMKIRKLKAV